MTQHALPCRAGQDRAFRMFSTIQDQQSSELSQGHIARRAKRLKVDQQELKLPRVTALDASQVPLVSTAVQKHETARASASWNYCLVISSTPNISVIVFDYAFLELWMGCFAQMGHERHTRMTGKVPALRLCLNVFQLRERDWANVITAHEGHTAAYTWRLSHLTLGEHVLKPPKKKVQAGPNHTLPSGPVLMGLSHWQP